MSWNLHVSLAKGDDAAAKIAEASAVHVENNPDGEIAQQLKEETKIVSLLADAVGLIVDGRAANVSLAGATSVDENVTERISIAIDIL